MAGVRRRWWGDHLSTSEVDRWIARARDGDVGAFNQLVDRFHADAYRLAVHLSDHADDAQDSCQEAMLAAWQAIGRFEGDAGRFRAWLLRIVANACHDQRRRETRRPLLRLDGPDRAGQPPPRPATGASPEDYAARNDLRRLLVEALRGLTDAHRTILVLDMLGLRDAEMAGVLDVEVGTVKSRLCRARVQLRAALSGHADASAWMEPSAPAERWKHAPTDTRAGADPP